MMWNVSPGVVKVAMLDIVGVNVRGMNDFFLNLHEGG
jgi:hypothetical protein